MRKGDQGVLWSVEGECHLGQEPKGFVQTSWLEDGGTASLPQEPLWRCGKKKKKEDERMTDYTESMWQKARR